MRLLVNIAFEVLKTLKFKISKTFLKTLVKKLKQAFSYLLGGN